MAAPPRPKSEMQLGKYELLNRLAVGGMAEVFLARAAGPMGFEKTLVVKRILPHMAEDPSFVAMFLSEAKLAARLNHPHIVQIFEFGEVDGVYFLAMEYIDGPDLRTLLKQSQARQRPLPLALCARLIASACEGLAFAHDFTDPATGEPLGLIHRDISPDNLLVSRQGAVKVVDFGIAKAGGQAHKTQTGIIKGKVAYMPPEQIRASPLDRRVDVYALGVVLYELLTGQRPFEAPTEASLMQSILFEPPVPAVKRRPDLPEALKSILDRALAKERSERYPDCRALHADLEDFILSTGKAAGAYQLAQLVAELIPASGAAATARPAGQREPQVTEALPEALSRTQQAPSKPLDGARPPADTVPMEPVQTTPQPRDTLPMEQLPVSGTRATPTEGTGLRTEDYAALLKPERKWLLPLVLGAAVLAAGVGYFLAGSDPEPAPLVPTPVATSVKPSAPPVADKDPALPPPESAEHQEPAPAPEAHEEDAQVPQPEHPSPPSVSPSATQKPRAPKTGTLHLIVQGWGTIWVDGKNVGQVPPLNKLELSAGRHELKLVNPAAQPYRATVVIPAGGTLVHRVTFQPAASQ